MKPEDITPVLEAQIDKYGLTHILVALELICMDKAEHIRQNWQDRTLARQWDKAATACIQTARKIEPLDI